MSKSAGTDKIPVKMFRIAANVIALSLTFIFNLSIPTGEFVDDWKKVKVTPIHEDSNKLVMSHYRPISVLPIIIKIFEQEIFQAVICMNENN